MLKGKTVIVTGGSRGIGKAICLAFAKEGANVVVNYSNTNPEIFVEELKALGVEALAVKCDVSNFDETLELINETKRVFGTIDVVVNNAGVTKDNLLMVMKEEEFDEVIDVNLKGTFNVMRHAIKVMLKQKSGSIINISSVSGVIGNPGQANYSASKAGVIGLTKATAKEVASRGITVNAVAPGFIKTDMTEVLGESLKEKVTEGIPLKRFGEVEEIADTVVFLARNRYVTGQVIAVDGGLS